MSKTVTPDVYKRSYNCPRCGVLCPQEHYKVLLNNPRGEERTIYLDQIDHKVLSVGSVMFASQRIHAEYGLWDLVVSVCTECDKYTIWENDKVIFPFTNEMPEPEENMPDDVKGIYEEAAQVFQYSPRASAGLLRLAIETLLINHLGVKKNNINPMIQELVSKGVPDYIQKGLDVLRFYGNKGIHFGEIDLNDDREKVVFLFRLINILTKELITKKIEIDSFYGSLPDSFKESVERRDAVKK